MGITCICIMKSGVKQMLVSHSSIGKGNLLLVYQLFFSLDIRCTFFEVDIINLKKNRNKASILLYV